MEPQIPSTSSEINNINRPQQEFTPASSFGTPSDFSFPLISHKIKVEECTSKEVGELFRCKHCSHLAIDCRECMKCGYIYCGECIEE